MRLHHVFLRGGLALLLLAGAGAGALSQPARACGAAHATPVSVDANARC